MKRCAGSEGQSTIFIGKFNDFFGETFFIPKYGVYIFTLFYRVVNKVQLSIEPIYGTVDDTVLTVG